MAQTAGGDSVAIIRTVMPDTADQDFTNAELDHVTRLNAEILEVGLNPTHIDSTVNRTSNGRTEIITVMVWV